MVTSRLIRFAVSLYLTVSSVLPLPAFARNMPAAEQAASTCPGCGHCQVDSRGAYCGCCRFAKSAKTDKAPCGAAPMRQIGEPPRSQRVALCRCALEAPPATPAVRQRSVAEQLSTVTAQPVSATFAAAVDQRVTAGLASPAGHLIWSPRDGQRQLCIWQI